MFQLFATNLDTGDKFAAGVFDTNGHGAPWHANITPNFEKMLSDHKCYFQGLGG
jgi:hypothetical protein